MRRLKERKQLKRCLPIGTIRIRRERRPNGRGVHEVRMIKVRTDGPIGRRWIQLARFTWEQTHGPIPAGLRVVHKDGNSLNDNPLNYALMTAGEVIQLHHRLNPEMSRENRKGEKRRSAIAEHNRLRGRLRRAQGFLPSRWYIIDAERRIVFDEPFRSRRRAASLVGIEIAINGAIARRRLAGSRFRFARGEKLAKVKRNEYELKPLSELQKVQL